MRPRRKTTLLSWLFLAGISYGPLLASRPGQVAADTKQYLYLDPGRLTVGAASMWDPNVGFGTVTHQNIGYLLPMGPYYWLINALGIPYWVGQRIWMGSLMFAAGTGVLWCARLLGLRGPGPVVAAVAYTCTPYIIDYIARISAILMPWAALGWMLGLVILSVRRGGWRYPAALALILAVVGGVNATSILLVGLAPLVWLIFSVVVTREVSWRAAAAAVGRIAVLGVVVSVWWVVGLWAEGSYGISILQYTETVPTVASTSLASEVLRGLGYWFFYGQDKVQPWTEGAVPYMQDLWLIGLSFVVPALCMVAGALTRWKYRTFCIALVLVGVVAAVGTYPFNHPSPVGAALKSASTGSSIGLAMRSSNRVLPVVVLGLALMLGSGVSAVFTARRAPGVVMALLCGGLAMADLQPMWTGGLVASNLARPSQVPDYWQQAAAYLDSQGSGTRVLGVPGEDFAAYRWGVTEDPVLPGLMTRPYAGRQVVPQGEPGSVDLLAALDGSIQDGVFDPSTLAPIARLTSVGQILVQSDQQYERYAQPIPAALWQQLSPPPPGTTAGPTFGTPAPTPVIRFPLLGETQLGLPTGTTDPPPLAVLNVQGAAPIVHVQPAAGATVVSGNGQGLVDSAAAGLLDGNPTVFYSSSLDQDPNGLAQLLAQGAALVVTDTNALQGHRWGSLQNNDGYVQQRGETPLVPDPSNQPLVVVPTQSAAAQTTAVLNGVRSERATAYGNPITFSPEDRAYNASDGSPLTGWTVAAFSNAIGQKLQIQLDGPVDTDHVTLLQRKGGNRSITRVQLSFDNGAPVTADLGPSSLTFPGQTVTFPARSFSRLSVTILSTSNDGGPRLLFDGLSSVGFADVGIPGVTLDEVLQMPTDLTGMTAAASQQHELVYLMSRLRAPDYPPRTDPELDMARSFDVPTTRAFNLGGTARVSAQDSDALIDELIGVPAFSGKPGDPIVAANSSARLPGDRNARADQAVDGDPATAWQSDRGPQEGQWIEYQLGHPDTFDHLDLQVVDDGVHSVPRTITISAAGTDRHVTLPSLPDGQGRPQGSTTPVHVEFPALTGSTVRITIDSVVPTTVLDYYGGNSGFTDIQPVALAEVGLPGTSRAAPPADVPTQCRSDLVTIDGRPVDIAISGSTGAALAGQGLKVSLCGPSASGLDLSAGTHVVRTSPRLPVGWEIDQLWLGSAPGGAALGSAPGGGPLTTSSGSSASAAPPAVRVTHQDRTHVTAQVASTSQPSWFVLGQSLSRGWSAQLHTPSGDRDLGAPRLIDGYANGWYLPAGALTSGGTVTLAWKPERVVWAGLLVSAVGIVASALLALLPLRRKRRAGDVADAETDAEEAPVLANPVGRTGSRPGLLVAVVSAVAAAAVAGLISAPWAAAPVGLLVLIGCLVDRTRVVLAAGAGASILLAGAYVFYEQHQHRFFSTIQWPASFHLANSFGWASVCLLVADAVVVLARTRPWERRSGPGDIPGPVHAQN